MKFNHDLTDDSASSLLINDSIITHYDSCLSSDRASSVTAITLDNYKCTDNDEHLDQGSSVMGSSLNLVNAIMGTGIIGLPLALHLCGFWVGLLFSVLIAYLTCFTMHITILCGLATQTFSLVALCEKLIGRVGSHIVNFIIFFHTAGTAVSYYLLLGDTLPGLLVLVFPNVAFLADRRNVILAFGLLCTFPLSLSRSTAKFVKWSAISVLLLMLMLLGVLIRVPYYLPARQNIELEVVPVSEDMFKGLAIISLSFGCSQNLFGVYTTTRNQKPSNWLLVCFMAIAIAFTVNIVFAVMAYMCFGKNVQANILLNFPENDPGIRLVKLALGLFMVLTIPLCMHPCREAVMLMFGININNPTKKQHYTVTVGVFLVVLYFGATLTSLGKVFDVIGGFSTTVLGFLLPGCAYIYLFSGDLFQADYNNKYASWKLFFVSLISIVIAVPVMFYSVKDAVFK
ncbi:hypothetical protein PS15p_210617 [Mucor circinelloides]